MQNGILIVLDDRLRLDTFSIDAVNGELTLRESYSANRVLNTLFAHGENELFAGTTTGTMIFQVNEDGSLELVGGIDLVLSNDPVVTDGSAIYATMRSDDGDTSASSSGAEQVNQLVVYNIEQRDTPQLTATFELDQPKGLALEDNWLLVCHAGGLMVYDVSERLAPVEVQNFTEFTCNDVIVIGSQIYLTHDEGIRLLTNDGAALWLASEIRIGD
ncbi:hypothetical protein [Parathalassolituus penaei]|uniref:Uncharacterized protein n=1 Tax=Parathalassolituus penaei TaxID=2997323 RepID=A0A9X3IRJ1_9GAMM|nr:hypothetical protein [Parathalassolituus penaei]MCY0964941.1 hypothetical protein [Parathalassolituus penaei]